MTILLSVAGVTAFVLAIVLGERFGYRRRAARVAWMLFAVSAGWLIGDLVAPERAWIGVVVGLGVGWLSYGTIARYERDRRARGL